MCNNIVCPINEVSARLNELEAKIENAIHGELVICPLDDIEKRCKKYPKCVEVQACCYPGGRKF